MSRYLEAIIVGIITAVVAGCYGVGTHKTEGVVAPVSIATPWTAGAVASNATSPQQARL